MGTRARMASVPAALWAATSAAVLLSGCGSGRVGEQSSAAVSGANPQSPLPRTTFERIPTDGGLIPPDAVIGSDSPVGEGAPITFQSRQPPAALLAWYRAPERRSVFSIESELQEGAEQVLTGRFVPPPGRFSVRLAPGINGGTTATLIVTAT